MAKFDEHDNLIGPSLVKDRRDALLKKAAWHKEQAKQLEAQASEIIKDCKHQFDDGTCSTQNMWLHDACVICGR